MTEQYDYDLFVIGAGSGGVRAARMAATSGAKVAIAEEKYLGGTCVNVGCVPKKLMVYASHYSDEFEEAKGFGWELGESRFNWSTLIDHKNKEIERLNGTVKQEAIRPNSPQSYQEAWDVLNDYSYQYNHQRLHAGIKYLRPADMFFGRAQLVLSERKIKIESARKFRKQKNFEERMKNMH